MLATPLEWTAAEQDFARTCQRAMRLPETGLATGFLPFVADLAVGGSTDAGDTSKQVPVGMFVWPTAPLGVSAHTWAVTACGGMSIGDSATLAAARILAGAGFDLLTDAALREQAKAEFTRRRGPEPFVSPIPDSRTAPRGLPRHMTRTGQDDVFSTVRGG
jgi:aminobenzoyl-glutamate utilization protein B